MWPSQVCLWKLVSKQYFLLWHNSELREFSSFIAQFISSVAHSCLTLETPWPAARQASLSITNSRNLLKLVSIKSVMPSNHLILCHPLLLPTWIFPSIRAFSNESVLHIRWPKYWSFSFSISPSNEAHISSYRFFSIAADYLLFLFTSAVATRNVSNIIITYAFYSHRSVFMLVSVLILQRVQDTCQLSCLSIKCSWQSGFNMLLTHWSHFFGYMNHDLLF